MKLCNPQMPGFICSMEGLKCFSILGIIEGSDFSLSKWLLVHAYILG